MTIEKCPFCGGEVSIALCGDGFDAWWFITRGHGENACKCRLFMESEKFNKDSEMADFVADDLIAAWNRRAQNHIGDTTEMVGQPDGIPLTLDELRQMDGCNDGTPIWIEPTGEYEGVWTAAWYIWPWDTKDFEIDTYADAWLAYRTKPEGSEG